MEFRLDFTFRIMMDVIYYVINIALFEILFLHTPLIAGWTNEQMMIFIGSFLLVDAINMTIFSTNMWWLPYYVNRGDLDYYLIRPVSPLFFLSLREFSANSFINTGLIVSDSEVRANTGTLTTGAYNNGIVTLTTCCTTPVVIR